MALASDPCRLYGAGPVPGLPAGLVAELPPPEVDPPLLPVGAARAAALDRMLGDVVLQGIWSSDTQRTRDTAGPTATARDMPLKFYDPRDSDALVKRLKAAGGTHLVVGHSNTVPALVHALGGVKGPDLPETEYDRLMVVVVPETGPPAVQILRYGTPAH